MKKELPLSRIISAENSLKSLMEESLPIKLSVKIMRLYKEINTKLFYLEENKEQIIEKYAERDENGEIKQNDEGSVVISNELNNMTMEVNFAPIKEEELEGANISPFTLLPLDPFIENIKEE